MAIYFYTLVPGRLSPVLLFVFKNMQLTILQHSLLTLKLFCQFLLPNPLEILVGIVRFLDWFGGMHFFCRNVALLPVVQCFSYVFLLMVLLLVMLLLFLVQCIPSQLILVVVIMDGIFFHYIFKPVIFVLYESVATQAQISKWNHMSLK